MGIRYHDLPIEEQLRSCRADNEANELRARDGDIRGRLTSVQRTQKFGATSLMISSERRPDE
jgi:hypothetical protein